MRLAGSFAVQKSARQSVRRSPNATTRRLQEKSQARQKAISFYGDDDNTLERFKLGEDVKDNTLKRFSTELTDVVSFKEQMEEERPAEKEEDKKYFKSPEAMWKNHHLFHPSSPKKISWDMMLGVLVLYSVISVSYRIGFDNPTPEPGSTADQGFYVLDWTIDILFIIDMFASFNTVVMDEEDQPVIFRKSIASIYVRGPSQRGCGWFWIDFFSTVPVDRISSWLVSGGNSARMLKMIRILRLLRLMKLLRLFKLSHIMGTTESEMDINPAMVNLVKLLFAMVGVAHVLACIFFQIHLVGSGLPGTATRDEVLRSSKRTWVQQYSENCDPGFQVESRTSQYIASLYWTIATMTAVGYGDVSATNDAERLFSILTQVAGAAVFGFVVGNITHVVESIDVQASSSKRKMQELRAYLIDRSVPKILTTKIKAYYTYYLQRKSSCDEELLLSELSPGLRGQLIEEASSTEFGQFALFCGAEIGFISSIFTRFKPIFHLPQEVVVRQGTIGKEIYFLQYGKVEEVYTASVKGSRMEAVISVHENGSHFGETCVFRQVPQQTNYRAVTYSNLLIVKKEDFMETLQEWPDEQVRVRAMSTMRTQLFMKVKLIIQERTDRLRRTESAQQRMTRQNEEQRKALQAFDTVTFEDGEALMKQGEKVDQSSLIFIVVAGEVRIVIDGEEVAQRNKGACLGEGALLGTRRNADIFAVGKVVCATLDAETFYVSDDARRLISTKMRESSGAGDDSLIHKWNTGLLRAGISNFFSERLSVEDRQIAKPFLQKCIDEMCVDITVSCEEMRATVSRHPRIEAIYMRFVQEERLVDADFVNNVFRAVLPEEFKVNDVLSISGISEHGLPRIELRTSKRLLNSRLQTQRTTTFHPPKKSGEPGRRKSIMDQKEQIRKHRRNSVLSLDDKPDPKNEEEEVPKYLVNPKSDFKMGWDLFTAIFVVYSVIVVPLRIGFGLEPSLAEFVLDCFIDMVFFVDMVIAFRTAFEDDHGRLTYDTKKIARSYLRGGFLVDFMSTVPFDLIAQLSLTGDWKSSEGEGSSSNLRSLKLIRILRLIRLLKLMRMAKLAMLITILEEEYSVSPTLIRMIKLTFTMCFFAHLISCGWFYTAQARIGDCGPDCIEPSWVVASQMYGKGSGPLYLASMYWAFTTVSTTGYGDITPQNDGERMFVVIAMLFGAILFGYVIGSMASLVGKLDIGASRRRDRLVEVKQYLRDRKISKSTRSKVLRYQEQYLDRVSVFNEADILAELSDSLRQELVMFLNAEIIHKIPLFDNQDEGFVVCVMALLRPEYAIAEDFVFREGELGKNMYFLVTGSIEILTSRGGKMIRCATIAEGNFFGEMAVLLPVRRTASVRALTACSFFVLTKSAFESIRIYYPTVALSIMKMINSTIETMGSNQFLKPEFTPSYEGDKAKRPSFISGKANKVAPSSATVVRKFDI